MKVSKSTGTFECSICNLALMSDVITFINLSNSSCGRFWLLHTIFLNLYNAIIAVLQEKMNVRKDK